MNYLSDNEIKNLKLLSTSELFTYNDVFALETNLIYNDIFPAFALEADFKEPQPSRYFVVVMSEDCSEISYVLDTKDERIIHHFKANHQFRKLKNFPSHLFNGILVNNSNSYTEPVIIIDQNFMIRSILGGDVVVSEYNYDTNIFTRSNCNLLPVCDGFEINIINKIIDESHFDFSKLSKIINAYREIIIGERVME